MSWFKTAESGAQPVSNTQFDTRPSISSATERQPLNTDPLSSQRPVPPRAATRPQIEATPSTPTGTQTSILGPTLRFKGELRAEEDFVLQGRVEGSIHHSQHLTIGTEGVVKGDSRASIIVVDGTVEGDLYALDSINLRATARVQGNLLAPRIAIAEGATFNGKVDMASATRAVRHMSERQGVPASDESAVEAILAGEAATTL
jgi:cytoskeletal protein CcmA (bactofilin family)